MATIHRKKAKNLKFFSLFFNSVFNVTVKKINRLTKQTKNTPRELKLMTLFKKPIIWILINVYINVLDKKLKEN